MGGMELFVECREAYFFYFITCEYPEIGDVILPLCLSKPEVFISL